MATRTKRTYSLSETTVRRVREMAEQYGEFPSQDRVVDVAVERLFVELQAKVEDAKWAEAAEDPGFQLEMEAIAKVYADQDSWPA